MEYLLSTKKDRMILIKFLFPLSFYIFTPSIPQVLSLFHMLIFFIYNSQTITLQRTHFIRNVFLGLGGGVYCLG